jgi:chromosome segregation protein
VHFSKLRLSGFKSFVEPTEFRIEPGLTGVVGPNGCGKSNLLEALRWVMGANSAKAMRADGMDDVIFAGAGTRPSRNHAEVTLTIDNAEGRAPGFADPVLEVARRIDRGAGSSYRINGREVRARDVQLLFADASTGANSPALVRQGQISELIAAKPQNRRRILEEAGGVSGLHTRRHEAELRLRAAETNLGRLDDVAQELEQTLGRLKREARQAEKYKRLAAEIRGLQAAVLHIRWNEARQALAGAEALAREAAAEVEAAAREAAAANATALETEAAIKPLREEEMVAAAVLNQLLLERDRIEHQVEAAQAEVARLTADLARGEADKAREEQIVEDAGVALTRLAAELAEVEALIAAAPTREPMLREAAAAADAARAASQQAVEDLAARAAAQEAARDGAERRVTEAQSRLSRTLRALGMATEERAEIPDDADPAHQAARDALAAAQQKLETARAAVEAAEAARAQAAKAESAARDEARKAEDQLGRLKAEARGLAQLTAPRAGAGFPIALDAVIPKAGLEAALAAAIGDDLDAALDARAAAYWAGRDIKTPDWPAGVEPLAPLIGAPPQLTARLAYTGVVDAADGARLQADLAPGCRLVSRQGDLWRWDGFTARHEAPRPAAIRLAQKTRLSEVEREIDVLEPRARAATEAQRLAVKAVAAADEALREARQGPPQAERALAQARAAVEAGEREAARRDARRASLDDTVARFAAERDEAQGSLEAAQEALDALGPQDDLAADLAAARSAAAVAREAAAQARAELDREASERGGRERRRDVTVRDRDDWQRRAAAAKARLATLDADAGKAAKALAQAKIAPAELEAKRAALLDSFGVAEARRDKAADAHAAAETARNEADRTLRAAEALAAQTREHRAAMTERFEAARERLVDAADRLREQAQMEPEELGRRLADEAIAIPADAAGVDLHLAALERERDAIGAVNLRAEEESAEQAARLNALRTERADLANAVARLREGIEELNAEGRERLMAAFTVIDGHFRALFAALFDGGQAELRLVESDDPLEAGLEIYACPPGKRLASMSLMSGGEQALTASALIFGVFLANPAPICVLDEVDAPLDDANVDRYCNMLDEMRRRTNTRFIAITHNAVTMSRMDRLYGVTMPERGVSQLVSVDLHAAAALAAQ